MSNSRKYKNVLLPNKSKFIDPNNEAKVQDVSAITIVKKESDNFAPTFYIINEDKIIYTSKLNDYLSYNEQYNIDQDTITDVLVISNNHSQNDIEIILDHDALENVNLNDLVQLINA